MTAETILHIIRVYEINKYLYTDGNGDAAAVLTVAELVAAVDSADPPGSPPFLDSG